MNPIVSIWCEYDIGQQNLIFRDAEAANRWILKNGVLIEMADEESKTIEEYLQDLIDCALICTIPVTIIE